MSAILATGGPAYLGVILQQGAGGFVPSFAAPSASVDIGDASVEGVSTDLVRADHQHAVPAPGAAPPAVGTGAIGVATTPARSDHTHDGVASVNPNGAGAETGALTFDSPMLSSVAGAIRHDNANTKTLPGGFVSGDIDTDANNGFIIPKLSANLAVPIPTNTREGRKITFKITQEATTRTVSWTGGAGGYLFASGAFAGSAVTVTQFDDMLAAMGDDEVLKIGFEFDGTLNRWLCVALAGIFA